MTSSSSIGGDSATLPERLAASPRPSATVTVVDRRGRRESRSHRELLHAARCTAGSLQDHGYGVGARVAVVLRPQLDAITALLGIWFAGAAAVLLPPPSPFESRERWRARCHDLLTTVGADALVRTGTSPLLSGMRALEFEELRRGVPGNAPAIGPDHTAVVTTTSGSTATPRVLLRSHLSYVVSIDGHAQTLGLDPQRDRFLGWSALHRRALLTDLLSPLAAGIDTILLSPDAFAARPLRWLDELSSEGATVSAAPNFAYRLAARQLVERRAPELDLSRWRIAISSGEPVEAATVRSFAAAAEPFGFDPRALVAAYGCSEVGGVARTPIGTGVRIDRLDREALAAGKVAPVDPTDDTVAVEIVSCGRILPRAEVRITDASGEDLDDRYVGEVTVRRSGQVERYANPDGGGEDRFRDGWFHTGDFGYLDDGELFVTGRRDDVIILNGNNVAASHVEELAAHALGAADGQVAAMGITTAGTQRLVLYAEVAAPDDGMPERIREAVVRGTGHTPDEINLHEPGWLPRTDEGKVQRSRLRELDAMARSSPSSE